MEKDGYKLAGGKIAGQRQEFYLDADGTTKWSYLGVIDWEEIDRPVLEYVPEGEPEILNNIVFGHCDVCGKNPLRYNFILKYSGSEKLDQIAEFNSGTLPYAIVGSECIHSLSHVDMLKVQRDRKALEEKKQINNGKAFGTYLRDVLNPQNQRIWSLRWKYFGHDKNLGGSVKYLWEKCLSGVPMHEKTFGKELKQALKDNGIEIPNMREIKKIINWKPKNKIVEVEEEGPTYEDFRADDESIARAESAFERHAEIMSGALNDRSLAYGNSPEPVDEELPMVPAGMELEDFYGTSPITGKREVLHVRLIDAKTREPIVPDKEFYAPDWDPVIEEVVAVDWNPETEKYEPTDIRHIHLQKFLKPDMTNNVKVDNNKDPVLTALKILAGNDPDFAGVRNNIGFNGRDTEFGHSLADRGFLTEKQREFGIKMLKKYHRQIPKEIYVQIFPEVES